MTMCGVPVVYNIRAPINDFYFHKNNCVLCVKKNMINTAETLLKNVDSNRCREVAIEKYSLEKSYNRILKCLR